MKKDARKRAMILWSKLNEAMSEANLNFFIELTSGNVISYGSDSGYICLASSMKDYEKQMDEELHG